MVTGGSYVPDLGQAGQEVPTVHKIYYADGSVAGSVSVYSHGSANGSVRAQLELRFADKSSIVDASGYGLEPPGYEARRPWVVVKMEPRQGVLDPMRFSVNIPGKAGISGDDAGFAETILTNQRGKREIVEALRAGCAYPHDCDCPVCRVVADR